MTSRIFSVLLAVMALSVMITPTVAQDTDAFPVTIEHQYGSTTITEAPQRVVTIGYTEQDFLLAVGITPVAVRYWYGDENDAIFPWAEDKVEGDLPVVLNMPFGSINYEAILALEPDLISAVTAGITQEEYDVLSQIAPTISQTDAYISFGMPWQDVMQMVGDAVGKSAEAAAIVAAVDNQFADVRTQHPEFAGKSIAVAYAYEGTYGFYTSQDSRGRFFTDLGFVIPDELVEIAGESFYADVSAERVDLLDQDVIAIVNLQFIEGGREALESDPLFSQLKAVQEGRVIYLDEQSENALGFSSPLSLTYALDATLPQLEAVFGGSTVTITCEEGFRSVEHNLGELCIPVNPQRIAAIDLDALALMRLLDIQPVAYVGRFYDEWLKSTPEWGNGEAFVEGAIDVGYPVNVERLLTAQPDLIITNDSENYDQLNAIAPTILFDIYATNSTSWSDYSRYIGNILNANEETEAIIEQTEERIAVLSDLYQANVPSEVVSVILYGEFGILSGAPYFVYNQVMNQANIVRPEIQSLDSEEFDTVNEIYWQSLSEEQLNIVDADVLVMMISQNPDELAFTDELVSNIDADPLWSILNAVQNDRFYTVPYQRWISFDPYSVNRIIDDLFLTLLEVEPAEVAANPFIPTQSN